MEIFWDLKHGLSRIQNTSSYENANSTSFDLLNTQKEKATSSYTTKCEQFSQCVPFTILYNYNIIIRDMVLFKCC